MADSQRKTANLFDESSVSIGYWISGTGTVTEPPNATYGAITDKIPVNSAAYTLWYYGTRPYSYSICWYDDTDTFISRNHYTYADMAQPAVITAPVNATSLILQVSNGSNTGTDIITNEIISSFKIMLNAGSTALPYEPYWKHSLRKLTTATEAVENPLYSDGTAITAYTLKGNTTQSGTPTPSNPVSVNGVGNKTANLFDKNRTEGIIANTYINQSGEQVSSQSYYMSYPINVIVGSTYTWSFNSMTGAYHSAPTVAFYNDNDEMIGVASHNPSIAHFTFTVPNNTKYLRASVYIEFSQNTNMLLEGSTTTPDGKPLDYIPYGYEISISSNGTALTPMYLGEVETTRNIYKLILTGEETWYDDALPKGDTFSYRMRAPYIYDVGNTVGYDAICSHFQIGAYYAASNVGVQHSSKFLYFRNTETTLENWKQWLADQYSNGTPVIVWYRLAGEETAVVNEPLMKIGDYADSISNATAIPTTEGANSITVDTTVQPSEFRVTWTGWHNAYVKEWDGSDWQ